MLKINTLSQRPVVYWKPTPITLPNSLQSSPGFECRIGRFLNFLDVNLTRRFPSFIFANFSKVTKEERTFAHKIPNFSGSFAVNCSVFIF